MRTSKLITSKDLITADMLRGSTSRRETQHDFHRRFITPSVWKVQKDHVQTTATRSFATLQRNFAKELARVIKMVVYSEYTVPEARRVSKQIFREYYKKAYVLGVKASGAGMSAGYTLFINRPSVNPEINKDEDKWSIAAATSELSFWNKFLKAIEKHHVEEEKKRRDQQEKPDQPVTVYPVIPAARLVPSFDYRILMYVKALEAHFDAGRVVGAPYNSVVYWTKARHHSNCPGCEYMSKISPVPKEALVTTPRAGMCSCLSNCRCTIKIVPKPAEEVRAIRNNTPPKEVIIREMKRRKYN